MPRRILTGSAIGLLVLFHAAWCDQAGARPAAKPGPTGVAVLDMLSFWRMYHTLQPPVVDADGMITPYLLKVAWLDEATAPPPAGWDEPNFDDSAWLRTMGRGGLQTPYLARQCLRGRFGVTAPAQVKDLKLSIEYHGGVVVYLNGKELTRQNMPAGPVGDATLAEAYPLEAFVGPTGGLLAVESTYIPGGRTGKPDAESARRMASRNRRVEDFVVPSSALRQGVNVLAIEIVRSAFNKAHLVTPGQGKGRSGKYDWGTCDLLNVRLAAGSAEGLTLNASRPPGLQVWNSDAMSSDSGLDYGDVCEPLRPIRIVAARNGLFSGKVVVGSTKAISGLKATAGELKGPGGSIPASAASVRYGYPWHEEWGFTRGDGTIRYPYPQWAPPFGALLTAPPAEANVVKMERAASLTGAVVPVWVTVKVPKDAKAGTYAGELRIEVRGEREVVVPVRLEVSGFLLPDTQDNRTWVEMIEVPDTTAVEYNLPLWGERHMEMIAESFRLISPSGTRVVHLPAIAHTNLGNAESMIRWVRKGPGQYEWDFSVMDKYLDLAQKNLGTPKVVVLQVWDLYMRTTFGKRFEDFKGLGQPQVTMLDRATGKTELATLPKLEDAPSKAIWQGLIGEVRKRLARRGIEKALMLGMFTDATPPKEHIQFFHDIAPDLPWVQQGHGRWKDKIYGISDVAYQATVWGGFRFGDGLVQTNQRGAAVVQSLLGWKNPRLDAVFERNQGLDAFPVTRWRFYAETGITSELRGVGRIGADYWKAVKNKEGRRAGWVHSRFPEGAWGGSGIQLNLCSSALAPGPEGPLATQRLLAFCEGVQDCEARIVIEKALARDALKAFLIAKRPFWRHTWAAGLLDDALKSRMDPDLAARCRETLDRRLRDMWRTLSNHQLGGVFFFGAGGWRWAPGITGHRWHLSSGWQDNTRTLFDLAAQVQRATGS